MGSRLLDAFDELPPLPPFPEADGRVDQIRLDVRDPFHPLKLRDFLE